MFWNEYIDERDRVFLKLHRAVPLERILATDPLGDGPFPIPHLLVEFVDGTGPFTATTYRRLERSGFNRGIVDLDPSEDNRTPIFPKPLPGDDDPPPAGFDDTDKSPQSLSTKAGARLDALLTGMADLLADVVRPIQITPEAADDIARALRSSDVGASQARCEALRVLDQRRRTVTSKLDRGYDDFVSGRISEEFWTRKSREWEVELQTVDGERARLEVPRPLATATAEKILELAKQVEFLYKRQDRAEQHRLLETVLSNCTFDRGSLYPTYNKPFDLLVRGSETEEWRGRRDSSQAPRERRDA